MPDKDLTPATLAAFAKAHEASEMLAPQPAPADLDEVSRCTPERAKEMYRDAWAAWLLTTDESTRLHLEQTMDALQPRITKGPGPEWRSFAETLPGFLEFWERWRVESIEKIDRLGLALEPKE